MQANYAPERQSRYEKIKADIIKIISSKEIVHRNRWSLSYIEMTALELVDGEKDLGIDMRKIYSLIEYDSDWKFWRCTDNKDKSENCGLTKQNSRHWNRYCWKLFDRACNRWEMWLPWLNIRIMFERFKECKEFSGSDLIFMCYNLNQKSRRKKKTYLDIWRKHLKKFRDF